jgi:hypothetical protein
MLLVLATSACTPLVGGAVLIGLVAVGAATSRCYDYLDVTVFDADGRKTCAATVTASDGGSPFELSSCYYAPLSDGRWTLRASLPGFPDALSTVEVEHAHDCIRHVQTVELTLNRVGTPAKPVFRPPPAVSVPTPATPAAPAVTPSSTPPAIEPAAPASAAPASAPPSNSTAPSLGVFPDHTQTTR